MRLWDTTDGHELPAIAGNPGSTLCVAFSPNGQTLAAGTWEGTVSLSEVGSRQRRGKPLILGTYVWSLAYSPDGKILAIGSGDWDTLPDLRLCDAETLEPLATLPGHCAGITSLAFSSDGKLLASGSLDRTIRLWEVATQRAQSVIRGPTSFVSAVVFAADNRMLVSASWDKTIRIWDLPSRRGESAFTREQIGKTTYCVAFSPDSKTLASAGSGPVKLIDLQTRAVRSSVNHAGGGDILAAFTPDGKMLVTADNTGNVRLWHADGGAALGQFKAARLWGMAISPDGTTLASASHDGTVASWDLSNAQIKSSFNAGGVVRSVAFSPDGTVLVDSVTGAGQSKKHEVHIRNLRGPENIRTLPGNAICMDFSADDTALVGGGYDSVVRVWDPRTWELRYELHGHLDAVYALAISSDSRTLATGSWDGTVKLWNLQSGDLMLTLKPRSGVVYSVAFSPDGKMLAASAGKASDASQEVRIWHAATKDAAATTR